MVMRYMWAEDRRSVEAPLASHAFAFNRVLMQLIGKCSVDCSTTPSASERYVID